MALSVAGQTMTGITILNSKPNTAFNVLGHSCASLKYRITMAVVEMIVCVY